MEPQSSPFQDMNPDSGRRSGIIVGVSTAALIIGIISILLFFRSGSTWERDHEGYVEMQVINVIKDTSDGSATLVLQDKDAAFLLAIGIGSSEAVAIEYELYDKKPPRPLTPDLLKNLMESTDMNLLETEISHVSNSTYFAKLFISRGRQVLELDSRPSDAIALAMRFDCPIYVSKTVLDQYGIDGQTRRRQGPKKKLISEFFRNSYVTLQ